MLVGHLAVGFAARQAEPKLSLGTVILAALLADFVAFALMFVGLEGFQVVSRNATSFNASVAANLRYSHSLVIDVLLATVFAAAYWAMRGDRRGAALVFGAVLSHWPLDVISHSPDMPIVPGAPPYFGLGLWSSIPATLIVEGVPWAIAVVVYARATRAKAALDLAAFWIVVGFLTLAWYGNITGSSVPPSPRAMAVSSSIFFALVVAWAYWMNRARAPITQPAPAAALP
jgi:hypothetical protein